MMHEIPDWQSLVQRKKCSFSAHFLFTFKVESATIRTDVPKARSRTAPLIVHEQCSRWAIILAHLCN
jgi:hypothetical protein